MRNQESHYRDFNQETSQTFAKHMDFDSIPVSGDLIFVFEIPSRQLNKKAPATKNGNQPTKQKESRPSTQNPHPPWGAWCRNPLMVSCRVRGTRLWITQHPRKEMVEEANSRPPSTKGSYIRIRITLWGKTTGKVFLLPIT